MIEKLNKIEEIRTKIEKIAKGNVSNFIFRGENQEYEKISSTLYREQIKNIKDIKDIESDKKDEIIKNLYIPNIQKEIIENIKSKHFSKNTGDFEILTQIQHYGGKTNLIDFSKNFLIALFFACDGEVKGNGRLIYLDKKEYKIAEELTDYEKDLILETISKNNRVIFQSSIFVYPSKGFINKCNNIIEIKEEDKETILKTLKQCYNIYTDTIYNDLQGFITNSKNYKTVQTYFYIALSYQYKEAYEKAIKNYDKAIEINPNDANAYNNRGLAKYNLGKYKEAIEDYDKAIEIKPNHANAYYNRGLAKDNLGKYKEAIEDYDKAIEINPNYADAYYNRGIAKDNLGKYKEAIEDFDKAIEIKPNYAIAYNNRGNAKMYLKKYKEAIEDFDKAIEIKPNYAKAYNNKKIAENLLHHG